MRYQSRFFRSFLLVIFVSIAAAAAHADAVDDLVRARMAERHVPGVAVAVIKNGKVVKTKGYGVASVEFNVPVTPETVFEIGSVSKQLTAAGIMLLVQDGRIELDEKISKYLPGTPEGWKEVTVRNLLTHTSGVKSYSSLTGFELSKRMKRDDFIKELAPHPLDFPPGSRYNYSNSGYNLLGYIIESVSGKNYWAFMRERIFQPLGMTKTADRDPQYIIPNRAVGYEWERGRLTGRDGNLTDLQGAGAIVSTVGDLAKWDAALRGDSFLTKDTKAELWKPFTLADGTVSQYGLGWRMSDIRGHKMIGHTGQTAGFGAAIFRYVDDGVTVIVLSNLGEVGLGGQIASGIAKLYIPSMSLKAMKSVPETNSKLAGQLSNAIRLRMKNETDSDVMSAELVRSLSTERARNAGSRITAFGPLKQIVFVGEETSGGKTVYRYKVDTAERIFLWRAAVNDEGKVSELTLEEEE